MGRALLLLVLAACGRTPFVDRPTQVQFEPESTDFWALPFPSDLRWRADSSSNLEAWPGADGLLGLWLRSADERLRGGWGVTPGVFATLTGPISDSSLPKTAGESTQPDAAVFVLDVDPESPERGRRIPAEVSFWAGGDGLAPDNLLAVVPTPGFVRRPGTRYGLVVTHSVRDENRARIGRSRTFHDAFEDTGDADSPLVAHLAVLRAALAAEGFDLGRVVGGTVFTTADPNADLCRLAHWVESTEPADLAEPWQPGATADSYQLLTARLPLPRIQSGEPPYTHFGEGRIVWQGDTPSVQDLEPTRVALTIPRQPQPAGGFPVALYAYDSGGDCLAAVDDGPADWLAAAGIATVAFDYPLHGERASGSSAQFLGAIYNPGAVLDNLTVAASEFLRITRLVTLTAVDSSLASALDAGSASDGMIRFDPERLILVGQSLGATLSVAAATLDPRVDALVLGGAGGLLFESPAVVEALLSYDLGREVHLHRAHPVSHALQHAWDAVDPVARARTLAVQPIDRLLFAGFPDAELDQRSIAALAVALEVDLAGESADAVLAEALAVGGREPRAYPLSANVRDHTAAVVHVSTADDRGHTVLLERGDVRGQASSFAASVGSAPAAVVPAP